MKILDEATVYPSPSPTSRAIFTRDVQAKADLDKAVADCGRLKDDFIIATDEFNRAQREFYNTHQLEIFNSLQNLSEVRRRKQRLRGGCACVCA